MNEVKDEIAKIVDSYLADELIDDDTFNWLVDDLTKLFENEKNKTTN